MNGALEVWGGVECSIVRVGGAIRNQLLDTGHFHRIGDLDRVAELGIKTIRYPLLWELAEPLAGRHEWDWPDARMARLHALGIRPVAGLIHHGSGPSWTDVLDPDFPERLADYAGRVAARYPWLEFFAPINEPLTTARISGLYGLWHPHGRDEATFLRLTVAQCRAIAVAMRTVRQSTPAAQLVQTEDFGRVFSTPHLRYQAEYENERRWLSLDLLTGRVDGRHPFHGRLIDAGVNPSHLAELAAEPCPPDIVGIDHYLTSDRFLDERVELYPGEEVGGNGIERYVDVAAARADMPEDGIGLLPRLEELWARYRLPIAVTELHNGCTKDEQLRWLMEGWRAAVSMRAKGADIRAVTAWSLFGAMDWDSMLARQDGYYECGAFDVRSPRMRPTVIARAITSLASIGDFDHPVLDRGGWWRPDTARDVTRPILLAGSDHLISVLTKCCYRRRLRAVSVDRHADTRELLSRHRAWAAISTGGEDGETLRLCGTFADGSLLDVEASPAFDPHNVANAFLDLLVDGGEGAMRLTRADDANQYEFVAVERKGRSLKVARQDEGDCRHQRPSSCRREQRMTEAFRR